MNIDWTPVILGVLLGVAGSVGIFLYPVANRRARVRGARAHWRVGWLIAVPSMTAMFASWGLLAWVGPHVLREVTAPVGVLFVVLAAVVYAASARLVGRLRGPTRYSLELHTIGIYRWVRHPQGLALVLLAAGVALVSGSVPYYFTLPMWISVWTAYTYVEERFELVPTFGSTYEEYRKRTPRIIPDLHLLVHELRTRLRPGTNKMRKTEPAPSGRGAARHRQEGALHDAGRSVSPAAKSTKPETRSPEPGKRAPTRRRRTRRKGTERHARVD